jgi:hypothetical protein
MDDTKNGEEMERLRDLTLQKIGRNCVNFANMEQMLRLMRQTSFVHQLRRHQVRQRPGSGSRCRSLRAGPFETNGEASCAALCENETSFSNRRLAEWNPYSTESCRALCAELDEQRERLRQPHEHLISIVRGMREAQKGLAAALGAELGGK